MLFYILQKARATAAVELWCFPAQVNSHYSIPDFAIDYTRFNFILGIWTTINLNSKENMMKIKKCRKNVCSLHIAGWYKESMPVLLTFSASNSSQEVKIYMLINKHQNHSQKFCDSHINIWFTHSFTHGKLLFLAEFNFSFSFWCNYAHKKNCVTHKISTQCKDHTLCPTLVCT